MKISINEKRKQRYKDKTAHSRERIMDLNEWLGEAKEISVLASEKAFQEAVEAIIDVFAMLLSDMKLEIGDDYSNIEKIAKRNIINNEEEKICIEANGLRNRVIHKYNKIDEKRFVESAKELIPKLDEILNKLDSFIENGGN